MGQELRERDAAQPRGNSPGEFREHLRGRAVPAQPALVNEHAGEERRRRLGVRADVEEIIGRDRDVGPGAPRSNGARGDDAAIAHYGRGQGWQLPGGERGQDHLPERHCAAVRSFLGRSGPGRRRGGGGGGGQNDSRGCAPERPPWDHGVLPAAVRASIGSGRIRGPLRPPANRLVWNLEFWKVRGILYWFKR